jgi:L-ascorbate metabolism protein UlaG (beta-lactamase superfamily)
MFGAPAYSGPVTDHFDGARFRNLEAIEEHGLRSVLRFMLSGRRGTWTPGTSHNLHQPPPPRVNKGELRVTFVNHSTVLLQLDGLNILTDPIWSDRCSPVSWTGPKRVRPPGIALEDLPPLDIILLSHNHYDHCDLPTLRRLAAAYPAVRVVTGLGNRALVAGAGFEHVTELDWGECEEVTKRLRLTALPAQHFSGRGIRDRQRTLWLSFLMETEGGPVYFAADSGWGSHFAKIGEKYGPLRLALLPIGAYLPRWFMRGVHIDPEEAVRAHLALRARMTVAIHFGTFELGGDGQHQAVEELHTALDTHGVPRAEFRVLDFGEGLDIPALCS